MVGRAKHGYGYGTPPYGSWRHMKRRCMYHPNYQGVEIDPRWMTFEGFLANPPAGEFQPGMHLARYGDVGPYSPENCRWLTNSQNAREAVERQMIRLPDGRFADDVAAEHGIQTNTWYDRFRRGRDITEAVTTPVLPRKNRRQRERKN